jgi:hypothetical protein
MAKLPRITTLSNKDLKTLFDAALNLINHFPELKNEILK